MSEGPKIFVRRTGMPAGSTSFTRPEFVKMSADATDQIIQSLKRGCDEGKECSCLRGESIFAAISRRHPSETPNTVHTAIAEAFQKMLAKPVDMNVRALNVSALAHLRDCEATFTKRAKRKREKKAKKIKKKRKATDADTSSGHPPDTSKTKVTASPTSTRGRQPCTKRR